MGQALQGPHGFEACDYGELGEAVSEYIIHSKDGSRLYHRHCLPGCAVCEIELERSRSKRLAENLKKYGSHLFGCELQALAMKCKCSCGLEEALREYEERKP